MRGHGLARRISERRQGESCDNGSGERAFQDAGNGQTGFCGGGKNDGARKSVLLDEIDMTEWHEYKMEWRTDEAVFRVDAQEKFRVKNPPNVPLGFVAWVDNNATTMGPGKEFSFRGWRCPSASGWNYHT